MSLVCTKTVAIVYPIYYADGVASIHIANVENNKAGDLLYRPAVYRK